jgi:hypothetical protein
MVWPLSILTTPAAKPPPNKTPMAAIGDHYEDLLRFYIVIYFLSLMSDWPQSMHHADKSVNAPHHLDTMGLWVQLLTFFLNGNNRKKNQCLITRHPWGGLPI